MRQICPIIVFLGLGCQSFSARPAIVQVPVDPTIELPMTQSIKDLEKIALKQAADLAAKRQETAACAVLDTFLKKYPERWEARFAYAELLFQAKQGEQARVQFEELLDQSQELKVNDARLLRIHDRLADVAQGSHDAYGEHLHRGIGLYLMAWNHEEVVVGQTTFSAESLRTKAMAELTQAHELKPDEARPCWYLHCVYHTEGQKSQADNYLRLAHQCARQSRLTPSERSGIDLAMRSLASEKPSR